MGRLLCLVVTGEVPLRCLHRAHAVVCGAGGGRFRFRSARDPCGCCAGDCSAQSLFARLGWHGLC